MSQTNSQTVHTESRSLYGRCFGRGQYTDYVSDRYWTGDVVTPVGVVITYSQHDYARLDFAYRGRHFIRTYRRGLTPRGLATVAGRFAREIAGTR